MLTYHDPAKMVLPNILTDNGMSAISVPCLFLLDKFVSH